VIRATLEKASAGERRALEGIMIALLVLLAVLRWLPGGALASKDLADTVTSSLGMSVVMLASCATIVGSYVLLQVGRGGRAFSGVPPRGRAPWAAFVFGTAATVLVMFGTWWARIPLGAGAAGVPEDFMSAWKSMSPVEAVAFSVSAGVVEETVAIAVPVGFTTVILLGLDALLRKWGKHVPVAVLTVLPVLAGVAGVWGRYVGHSYQGAQGAVGALIWGALLLALFVWLRSIFPLMLGHTLYDLFTVYDARAESVGWFVLTGAVLALTLWGLWWLRTTWSRPAGQLATA
jgi:hypothetical protein